MFRNFYKQYNVLCRNKRMFCQTSLEKTFTYGQDSVLKLRKFPKNTNVFLHLTTLWEDLSTVKVCLKDQDNKILNIDPQYFDVKSDDNKEIFIKYPSALDNNQFPYDEKKQDIECGIPEYSSIDLEFDGSLLHRTTDIDAKLKGDVRIINTSDISQDFVEIPRLKSENCEIVLHAASLFIKRYLEAQHLVQQKNKGGIVNVKRLGISKKLNASFDETRVDIPTQYVNPCDIHSNFVRSDCKFYLRNSTLNIEVFTGPMLIESLNTTIRINEGQFENLDLSMKGTSQADIGVRSIDAQFGQHLGIIRLHDQSKLSLRINEDLKDIIKIYEYEELEAKLSADQDTFDSLKLFRLLADETEYKIIIIKQSTTELNVSYENSSENLREQMLKKFSDIKQNHPGRMTKRKTE